ncbi:MAG: N-6 DNA methylase [Verrucomicrobiota bacterium]|nr:N-6 DNA methylase [Verrucomicrobiota bacterium]
MANPPYVKAHRLDYSDSDWRYFEERLGTPLDRLTNLYALFLLKIWEDLAPHGRAAVLLPAEFLNANFGDEIKERLVHVIRPPAILVFAPSLNLFGHALTTSAIVFLEKYRAPGAPNWLTCVESVAQAEEFVGRLCRGLPVLESCTRIDLATLNPRDKWLNQLLNGSDHLAAFPKQVGDYFECSRGIATGANDYFCLSRPGMNEHGLTEQHVEPCITKAADVDGLVFTPEKFEALAARGRRCFLLNPSGNGQALARYLELGEQLGIPQRHLPSHRPVWYLPENRGVADIWVAVFTRQSGKFILNTSGAKNLTCFHGLYARAGCETLAPLMTLFLNSSGGRRAFASVNRFYGSGLNKLEPKDVEQMPCPAMPKLSQSEANKLIARLFGLERVPLPERTACVDELAASYFRPTGRPEEPFSPLPHRARSRRRVEQ